VTFTAGGGTSKFFQAGQAESQALKFSGPQCQCGVLAGAVSRSQLWERSDLLRHLKSDGAASSLFLDNIANRFEKLAISTNEISKPDLGKIKVLDSLCQSYGMAIPLSF